MVTVNPTSITVVEAGATVTSTAQILTTINWSISPTSLPSTGGQITATINCLDQSNNPMASVSGIALNEGNSQVGTFPSTNSAGQSQFSVNIPANSSPYNQSYVFYLSNY